MKTKTFLVTVFTVVSVIVTVGGKTNLNASPTAESKSLSSSHKCETVNLSIKKNKAKETQYVWCCIYCYTKTTSSIRPAVVRCGTDRKSTRSTRKHTWMRNFCL